MTEKLLQINVNEKFKSLEIYKNDHFISDTIGDTRYVFDNLTLGVYKLKSSDPVKKLIEINKKEEFINYYENLKPGEKERVEGFLSFLEAKKSQSTIKESNDSTRKKTVDMLHLSLSNQCNLSCKYCFSPDKIKTIENLDIIYKAIDYMVNEIGKDSDYYVIGYNYTGEPFLDIERFQNVFKYTKKTENKTGKAINIAFSTNGTLLNDKIIKVLKEYYKGIDYPYISISIDGPPDVHDSQRVFANGKGSFEIIDKNINKLIKIIKNIKLDIHIVISKNYPYPLKLIKFFIDKYGDKICSIKFKPARTGYPLSFDNNSLDELKKGYTEFFDYLTDQIIEENYELLGLVKADSSLRGFINIFSKIKTSLRCSWGYKSIAVDYKGDFYHCTYVLGSEHKLGNVYEGINWDKFYIKSDVNNRGNCKECMIKNICSGTCHAVSWNTFNDELAIDPIECETSKFFIHSNIKMIFKLMSKNVDFKKMIREINKY